MFSEDDLKRAQEEAQRSGISLGDALIKLGLDEKELTAVLARQYGVPAVDLRTRAISPEVTKLVRREAAERFVAMPIERIGSVLLVAKADPSN